MKRLLTFTIGVMLLATGCDAVAMPTSTTTSSSAVAAVGETDTVTRVVDGDTLVVGDEKIRLIGVDTPVISSRSVIADV